MVIRTIGEGVAKWSLKPAQSKKRTLQYQDSAKNGPLVVSEKAVVS
jgi:hypothetical protein